ncbi:hypothetical protein [Lysinibacillus sp. FJAT-14222]|uniref:hypothetical protein n=1 Tax=Lysinibacillus sp. FJAT-14222 TaxID=1932366 RepID=UPI000A98916C|nr:hypothetical protein [Lysinibacillus sp. FJAT-14222]
MAKRRKAHPQRRKEMKVTDSPRRTTDRNGKAMKSSSSTTERNEGDGKAEQNDG